jgi:hypothetical protein
MKTEHLGLTAALLAGLSTAACLGVDAKAPAGFAELDEWTQLLALSAEGIIYRVRTEENEPEAKLDFWQEALKKRMVDAGYAFVAEAEVELGKTPGYYLELAAPVGQEDYTYAMAIAVRGGDIVIAEAAGEVSRFAKHKPAVLAAMQAIH